MRIDRRFFLRSTGVALALPALDAMTRTARGRDFVDTPQRMVLVCTSLGLHGPSLFPPEVGKQYGSTPYLDLLAEHRDQYTLFSGISHPDQGGADGHSSQMTWLTAATHPGLGGFRNTISIDQLARQKLGQVTRFPSLALSTHGSGSQSYTAGGVMVSAQWRPSVLFEQMFLQGNPQELDRQRNSLREGRSILDSLGTQTRKLQNQVSAADRKRLDEYFSSVREAEREFRLAGEWLDRPKPIVDVEKPVDIEQENDLIGRTQLLTELIPLILQTDSTRIITLVIQGRNDVPPIDGVTIDHHNLSHHGQDEKKIEQLQRVETELIKCLSGMLGGLKAKDEQGASLLDNTAVLFGSNLGNANAHDWRNLPILFAGGKFNHGQHVAFDQEKNVPLSNLFVSMLQHMKIETDRFATSSGCLSW